jgi:serine/threonine-protein kinase
LLQQVAAGLEAAHAYRDPDGTPKPILHRDLKPENLFLVRTPDDVISAKILDYGIAKVLGDTTHLSQEVRGTPLFMAFEQITAGTLSAQTDIWAFGLIAFYMLAGMPYWRSAEREGSSVQALFAEILTLPLVLPSVRLRQQGNGVELPLAFDAWLLRCINRDPSQRFPTVTVAVEALARVLDLVPQDYSPPSVRLLTNAEKTQNVRGAPAAGSVPSVRSVPALAATAHRSVSLAASISRWHWVAAGALAGALVLGAIAWLVADGDAAPSATAAPRPEAPRVSAGSPSASGSPSRGTPLIETVEIPSTPPREVSTSVESRADPLEEDARPSLPAESSDGVSHTRAPSRARKPELRRKPRPGTGEAYRVR